MPAQAVRLGKRLALGLAASLLGACAKPPDPQADYAIAFNLRCSTCNDFLSCNSEKQKLVFRIHELSFWQQIATIADYLSFSPKTEATRKLTVYRLDADTITIVSDADAVASIDAVAGAIVTDRGTISQADGTLSRGSSMMAICATMPRRDGFLMVRKFLGRPLPTAE